jgi:hypothetical protein
VTKIVSVHFPKAAGTSLFEILRTTFGERLHHVLDADPVDPASAWQIAPGLTRARQRPFPTGAAAAHGHMRGDAYPDATYRLTFLREPVDNLVSIYAFWRTLPTNGHAGHRLFLEQSVEILEFAEFPALQTLMSRTYFGGVDMRSFDFIGFHDRRHEDLARLASQLSLSGDLGVWSNRTPELAECDEILSNPHVLGRLRDLLRDDVDFYERLRAARD